jgi:hypothetical protein
MVQTRRLTATLLATTVLGTILPAQSPAPRFADPVLVHAGDKPLGQSRLYPSPVYHDVDGDGLVDLVVGDLRGHLTLAPRLPSKDRVAFGAEQKLKDQEGKILDFGNW